MHDFLGRTTYDHVFESVHRHLLQQVVDFSCVRLGPLELLWDTAGLNNSSGSLNPSPTLSIPPHLPPSCATCNFSKVAKLKKSAQNLFNRS